MKIDRKNLVRNLVLLAALAASLVFAVRFFGFSPSMRSGFSVGIVLASLNGLLAFLTLAWAYPKSDKVFFGAFFGNMIWKLVMLFAAFLFLVNSKTVHVQTALISMAAMTFLINLIEIGLLPSHGEVR